jgi:hypothetical protein
LAQVSSDTTEKARKFIDASLRGRSKPPSKAAYARAVKLARVAIEELTLVAMRVRN